MTSPQPALPSDPRNPWSRSLAALAALAAGDLARTRDIIEGLRHHPDLAPGVLALWQAELEAAEALRGAPPPLNVPADYTANAHGLFRPPFRPLVAGRAVPEAYPWTMALPTFAGPGNDSRFLEAAATALEARLARLPCRIEVVWTPAPDMSPEARAAALRALTGDLAAQVQRAPEGLTVLGGGLGGGPQIQAPFALRGLDGPAFHPGSAEALRDSLGPADLVLFLSGAVRLDPLALARAARLVLLSDRVILPLVPLREPEAGESRKGGLFTPFTPEPPGGRFTSRYPFRDMTGLNLALPGRFLRDIGLPDPRFTDPGLAGRDLAYRAWARGAWLVPLQVPALEEGPAPPAAEVELYKARCPNPWDRKRDLPHEVPKVSVYIPAWNASAHIERAVESVLSQDVADLEVCIANDGSRDGTLALLERLYSREKRVRWIDLPHGGIGHASNAAIRMSDSLYIGQLDSDDCLKPGAVRRLMTVLDENASVICAYGSCERIDAAGTRLRDEYSWPVFSREKMMTTSIVHHFRMFRRQAWARTTGFREDVENAVDYDLFLKMAELGDFRHVDEILYQRRWHGGNTSHLNADRQTENTHHAQRAALARQGLSRVWTLAVPDPSRPREVTYRRAGNVPLVMVWPDFSQGNPYQRLLCEKASAQAEFVAGDVDAALRAVATPEGRQAGVIFHLHWLGALFRGVRRETVARAVAAEFGDKLLRFQAAGGRILWTLHNHLSHDTPFPEVERALSIRIAGLADRIHLHCDGSAAEVAKLFRLPKNRLCISRHGHYIGAYSDFVPRDQARAMLGIGAEEDVILFTGMIRAYKGVDQLVTAFRRILADRPQARLLIGGLEWVDPLAAVEPALTDTERTRILRSDRFLAEEELQVFFRAADIAAYPYQRTLTSGSLLLALSFGLPVAIPRSAMTAEVLEGQGAGALYTAGGGVAALEAALRDLLAAKDAGQLPAMAARARARAEALDWPDFSPCLPGV
ncbi:MAG: glycosyltransferase [Pseudorhodobacter sp.]